ncbi:sulfite exporter TauE/SafE family protein [Pseudorhodobacter aquimaris]|uniref:sulfite exporter TauE/SafE family protein n=1 Tax=Pseudorhodobacter aquimaris TaxID=687412 RepID=UPI00067B0597|nr:sulfite exporter TauE/SafE family protein [Pseudorhodobacter aquimaris]
MSFEYYAILLVGAAAGGFINGLAGFGTALLALGFWLQIMPPISAVSMAVVMSVLSGLQGAWLVRRAIFDQPKRLARFLIPGIFGVPLGVLALSSLDPQILKLTVGGMMVLYGGFFSLRRTLPAFDRPTPLIDSLIGFVSGVLGGATSLSGALPTMWCSMRTWTKSETRAVLQPFNIIILFLSALVFLFRGNYTWEVVKDIIIALPITLLAAQVGIHVFKHLNDTQFRRLLVVMMFASGTILLGKELL